MDCTTSGIRGQRAWVALSRMNAGERYGCTADSPRRETRVLGVSGTASTHRQLFPVKSMRLRDEIQMILVFDGKVAAHAVFHAF